METSESAYELNHMLREQLQLLMRERDLAREQVHEHKYLRAFKREREREKRDAS